jgi:L-threonylcarbamoyladenylate synthase
VTEGATPEGLRLDVRPAVRMLRRGGVVALPTDTVYGLAVDPARRGATRRLFEVKGRPDSVALPVLVADQAQAEAIAGPGGFPDAARRLAERYWPGPLTLVVGRAGGLGWDLGGDERTVGLRCPDHLVPTMLCTEVGPLAVTSANRHGSPACTTPEEVGAQLGAEVLIVDGGVCDRPPSTVVRVGPDGVHCLRDGALSWEELLAVLR